MGVGEWKRRGPWQGMNGQEVSYEFYTGSTATVGGFLTGRLTGSVSITNAGRFLGSFTNNVGGRRGHSAILNPMGASPGKGDTNIGQDSGELKDLGLFKDLYDAKESVELEYVQEQLRAER